MTWFYITILAYLLFAVANIFDRYILHGPLQHPRVYAFYFGISGLFALFLIPFGFSIPSLSIIIFSLFFNPHLRHLSLYFSLLCSFNHLAGLHLSLPSLKELEKRLCPWCAT